MGLSTHAVRATEVKVVKSPLAAWARRTWRLALVLGMGLGLWLGVRWATNAPPVVAPALESFLADGGGGAFEVWGIYAPQEYFRLTQRDPASLDMDPSRELIFFLLIDTHEHDLDLPEPTTWWDRVSLNINGEGHRPWKRKLVMDSDHHQTIALAFPWKGDDGEPLLSEAQAGLSLSVPDFGDGHRTMAWQPSPPVGTPPLGGWLPFSLGALLPLLGGLLVAFSPCVVHMSTYYLPLFGAQSRQGPARARLALVAGFFTLGFAIPYTAAGIVVGYLGQFARTSPLLLAVSQPLTLVAGAMVLFFGLQLAGVFRLPFFPRLNLLPWRPGGSRAGYLVSGLLGLNLAVGCLGCVGGSLFAALLLYSGSVGSPIEGGAILFLFALAANVPFFLAALTLGRWQLRNYIPLSVSRYVPILSGAMLIALGLLILSGTESLLEDSLIRALGIEAQR